MRYKSVINDNLCLLIFINGESCNGNVTPTIKETDGTPNDNPSPDDTPFNKCDSCELIY